MMRRGWRSASRVLTLPLCAAAVACAAAERTPDTIVLASGTDLEGMQPLTTVHPMSRQVQRYLVFVTLARFSPALVPEPWAAVSWEWTASRRGLAVTLDSTLRWHDGPPVTCDDLRLTLDRARDPATGYARRTEAATVDSVQVRSAHDCVLWFAAPQAVVPPLLAELPLLPAHHLRTVSAAALRAHPFTRQPVGAGPYRLLRRDAGRRWIFERVPDFPARMGGPGASRHIVVTVVDEATTKVAGLISGALDMAGINPAAAAVLARDADVRVLSYPTFFTNWLFFNASQPPFDDVRVRRAVARSLDRARLVQAGAGGFGDPDPRWSPDAPGVGALTHDTADADALLDAAGWRRGADGRRRRNGEPLAVRLLTVGTADNPVEQLIQADLQARGITVRIETRDAGALLSAARATPPAYELLYTGVPGDAARSQLAALFDPAARGGTLDFGVVRTAGVGTAFAMVRAAVLPEQRRAAWATLFDSLTASMPGTPVFHARGVQGVSRQLQPVAIDLRGELYGAASWRRTR